MTKVYSGLSLADLEEEVKGKRIETISQQPQREDSREISSLETTACLPVLLPVLLECASIGIALHNVLKSYHQTDYTFLTIKEYLFLFQNVFSASVRLLLVCVFLYFCLFFLTITFLFFSLLSFLS